MIFYFKIIIYLTTNGINSTNRNVIYTNNYVRELPYIVNIEGLDDEMSELENI